MFRSHLLRGASACALTFAVVSPVHGQEALPTIDIAGASSGSPGSGPGQKARSDKSGGRLTGYNQVGPTSASKTDIPILQTPYSIQVVPRETLDDRQAVSLTDALAANVSGVSGSSGYYSSAIIRGFKTDNQLYRNGLRQIQTTDFETSNLQSIEVLKGPAAMLFGRVEPGGLINFVPKRPQSTPYFSVQQQSGNFIRSRTMIDATGPLTDDKSVLYRLNASFLRYDSFRDFVWKENLMVAPSLTWRPTEDFTLNLDGEYHRIYFVDEGFLPAVGSRPAGIPISRYLLDPWMETKYPNFQERALFAYDWTYRFVEDWSVTNRLSVSTVDYRQRGPDGAELDEKTGELARYIWFVPTLHSSNPIFQRTSVATNIDVKGKVVTGPFTHKLLAGFDYYNWNGKASGHCCDLISSTNIYNPNYAPSKNPDELLENYKSVTKDQWTGIYVQDQISFWEDRIHILLGGRHDWARSGSGTVWSEKQSFDDANVALIPIQTSANSPRAGVLLQPAPWLSFYGNYTRSYGANNGLTPNNSPLRPQVGTQFEGGAKAELMDGALTATFAYFDITKSNITRGVLGGRFVVPVGEAHSNGVEFDVMGRLNDNWSIIANFTHLDARVTKDRDAADGPGLTGKRLPSVPKNMANLWLKYEAEGDFHGLTLGGGVLYRDQQFGDSENSFTLPAYARVDGMASYKFKSDFVPFAPDLTFQVNVTNLLGTTYYESGDGRLYIAPGAPRAFIASLRTEF
jgi:iron complex outermembrane receptor protein